LRRTLQYLGVSTGNMEEGSFRCDANVSLRPLGSSQFGTRAEVKNMNSFRSVFRALEFEIERQARLLDSGQRVVQETRGWVETTGETVSQRSKEQAHDYRYFPEPDLPPLTFTVDFVESVRSQLPELPEARKDRFIAHFGLTPYDAEVLTATRAMAEFFEAAATAPPAKQSGDGQANLWARAKAASNWCTGELNRLLNLHDIEVEHLRVTPQALVELLDLIDGGNINQTSAKEVFEEMFRTGKRAGEIVQERGLVQINNSVELEDLVDRILAANAQAAADYHAGKMPAIGFLVGQVMKETRGRANAGAVTTLLKSKLDAVAE
ncbi:MAG: Asp-tRNA(Asn)/Glu-tRNA(Gln) amidotransferase subunit GatB, partial [Chloroflexota bacterium]